MDLNKCSKLQLWVLAARPKTLPAAVAPILVGVAAAFVVGKAQVFAALACFLGAMLLQIAVNLANDYFDAKNKIDSEERLGPTRVTQSGLIPAGQVKLAMIFCLVAASLVFCYLSYLGGLPIVFVGIASVLGALGYSGGPFPLASNGLGELFVFIFFGLIAVCGTFFIIVGELVPIAVIVSVPPGLLITAIMVINNLRDIDTDTKAGKRTLAVMLGRTNTILEYRILLASSYGVVLLMWVFDTDGYYVLLPLLTLPLARRLWHDVEQCAGRELNDTLADTAKLSLLFSIAFSVGLVIGALK
ncbi:MAG: 1,4-dihydroxy-2-naphthoate polyprenyltransferase [Desulfotalea sp.]